MRAPGSVEVVKESYGSVFSTEGSSDWSKDNVQTLNLADIEDKTRTLLKLCLYDNCASISILMPVHYAVLLNPSQAP